MGEYRVFIPLLGLLVPILGLLLLISNIWLKSPVARAIADRIRGRALNDDAALSQEVDSLAGEVQVLRRELAEMQERVDFTERLLSRGHEASIVNDPRSAN